MVDQPGAIPMWVPESITFNYTDATFLTVHKTAGFQTARDVATYFQNGSNGENVSSHYVVGLDGTIVQCVPESRGAGANCCLNTGHAGFLPTGVNLNTKTISIEHVDPRTDNGTDCPPAQKAASFKLIHDICKRHNIPMRRGDASGGIIGHNQIDPINRARCPGNYPWDELLAYLNSNSEGEDEMPLVMPGVGIGKYYEDKGGGRWYCAKTGAYLEGDNLHFFRSHGGCGGLVLMNEIKLQQINGKDATGTAIAFLERWLQIFDPKRKIDNPPGFEGSSVYLMHIDSGFGQSLLAKSLVDPLNKAVADKQAQIDTLNHQLSTVENADKQALMQQLQDALDAKNKLTNLVNQFVAEASALS